MSSKPARDAPASAPSKGNSTLPMQSWDPWIILDRLAALESRCGILEKRCEAHDRQFIAYQRQTSNFRQLVSSPGVDFVPRSDLNPHPSQSKELSSASPVTPAMAAGPRRNRSCARTLPTSPRSFEDCANAYVKTENEIAFHDTKALTVAADDAEGKKAGERSDLACLHPNESPPSDEDATTQPPPNPIPAPLQRGDSALVLIASQTVKGRTRRDGAAIPASQRDLSPNSSSDSNDALTLPVPMDQKTEECGLYNHDEGEEDDTFDEDALTQPPEKSSPFQLRPCDAVNVETPRRKYELPVHTYGGNVKNSPKESGHTLNVDENTFPIESEPKTQSQHGSVRPLKRNRSVAKDEPCWQSSSEQKYPIEQADGDATVSTGARLRRRKKRWRSNACPNFSRREAVESTGHKTSSFRNESAKENSPGKISRDGEPKPKQLLDKTMNEKREESIAESKHTECDNGSRKPHGPPGALNHFRTTSKEGLHRPLQLTESPWRVPQRMDDDWDTPVDQHVQPAPKARVPPPMKHAPRKFRDVAHMVKFVEKRRVEMAAAEAGLHNDTVRGKGRAALTAQACPECDEFFRSIAKDDSDPDVRYEQLVQHHSRHRFRHKPRPPMKDYWKLTFDPTPSQEASTKAQE